MGYERPSTAREDTRITQIARKLPLGRCCGGDWAAATSSVYKTEAAGLARPVALPEGKALLAQRLPGNVNPLLPFAWGLRRVFGVKEQVPAAWTAPGLHLQKTQAELVQGRGNSSTPSVSPVLGEGGIVRRRAALDHPVSDDVGPGELGAVGAAFAVAEHPPVPPGPVERPEVPVDNPVLRLVRVPVCQGVVRRPTSSVVCQVRRGER